MIKISLCAFLSLNLLCFTVFSKNSDYTLVEHTNSNSQMNHTKYYKHTAEEYKRLIELDPNIPQEQKELMINEVNLNESKKRSAYDYWTIYDICKVTSSYSCRPYFYAYARFSSGTGYPERIEKIQYANIDRSHNGASKQFSGQLYYHLEKYNKIYWDLNGDFYNNGQTTVGGGVSIGVGEKSSTNFSISYSANHYAYCHRTGEVTF